MLTTERIRRYALKGIEAETQEWREKRKAVLPLYDIWPKSQYDSMMNGIGQALADLEQDKRQLEMQINPDIITK